ncbi:MAG: tetraacyldisaccharide 4'-kinase [Campylobacterales bacterium]|nr:tetraacyldisaccharide 4'-kinase [Campylobacterales bacterium]
MVSNNLFFLKIEEYLYDSPYLWQKILSWMLLPLTLIYCIIVVIQHKSKKPKDLGIKVVSIGNIVLGGTGKTPFTIALASGYHNSAIVLRGYKRETEGVLVVSQNGTILSNVKQAGDEAMEYAKALFNSSVIVAENREEGIKKAKDLRCDVVFLDDGFRHNSIEKLDILLKPNKTPKNKFCLPSGGYKAPLSFYKKADIVAKEGVDFRRSVVTDNPTKKMVLVTAIARPLRLKPYVPADIEKFYYPDHHSYEKEELVKILMKTGATSILTTEKDAVKMAGMDLPLSILRLKITIDNEIVNTVKQYIEEDEINEGEDVEW